MRVACLDVPALPLQIAWRREPELRAQAVIVIDVDRPQGIVLWACERARAAGVLPGQRYAHALGLCSALRARVIAPELVDEAVTELRAALATLSPRVEPATEPGTFWLDGDGLTYVYPDRANEPQGQAWGRAIRRVVDELRYRGTVVVGFSRFATCALSRAQTGAHLGKVVVTRDEATERTSASTVPLARLDVAPTLRDQLARLGVTTLGQLVRLPAGGVLERFGGDAYRLYGLAAGERWDPLVATPPPETPDERVVLDDDIDDIEQLVFVLKPAIDRLLARLATRNRALDTLHIELVLRHAVGHTELREDRIKSAAPTLDARSLFRLVHLRMTGMPPIAPVHAARVWADDVPATREQLALFTAKPRRDPRAADEALARLRAELGEDAVVRAVLRDGHLPEASFGWERLVHIAQPSLSPRAVRPLVRRIHVRPQLLPQPRRHLRDDGWLLAELELGAVVRIVGPYVVSGGWWAREVHRTYHFAELHRGDCLWVYFDGHRRRWYCHGAVQ